MAGIDYDRLARIASELTAEQESAPSETDRRSLGYAIGCLRRIISTRPNAPSSWPPVDVTREMLETGRDTWVRDLLGVSRQTVTQMRIRLQIESFDRGGDSLNRTGEREAWLTEWRRRLQEAGWQPPTQRAG